MAARPSPMCAIRSKGQDRIAARTHMLEQAAGLGSGSVSWKDHIGEGRAAIVADVNLCAEAGTVVVGGGHDVLAVGWVDDNVLLVLRLVALGAVNQREQFVVHDGIGIGGCEC